MKVKRSERLNGEYRKAIYEIITTRLKNPYITEMFSVTGVDAASDLSFARVYVSVFSTDEEKKKRTFEEIAASAKTIRYELAHMMKSRTVPELKFYLDGSMDYGAKMDKLFKDINNDD